MPSERRKPLSAEALNERLPAGWAGDSAGIEREFKFDSYLAGVDFAVRVAQAAEQVDHHPDLLIGYKRVKVTFVTHDAGGVTELDLAGASATNGLF